MQTLSLVVLAAQLASAAVPSHVVVASSQKVCGCDVGSASSSATFGNLANCIFKAVGCKPTTYSVTDTVTYPYTDTTITGNSLKFANAYTKGSTIRQIVVNTDTANCKAGTAMLQSKKLAFGSFKVLHDGVYNKATFLDVTDKIANEQSGQIVVTLDGCKPSSTPVSVTYKLGLQATAGASGGVAGGLLAAGLVGGLFAVI